MSRHEPEMTAYLESKLSPHIVFLDVGAWTGYYTLLAAGQRPAPSYGRMFIARAIPM